jgi:hypothetical protein
MATVLKRMAKNFAYSIQLIFLIILTPFFLYIGLTAGIWLALLREWSLIGLGIAAFAAAPFILSVLNAPSFGAAALAGLLWKTKWGSWMGWPFFVLAGILERLAAGVWCSAIFIVFVSDLFVTSRSPWQQLPRFLWSCGIAGQPWVYMTPKEIARGGDEEVIGTHVFIIKIGYVVAAAAILLFRRSPDQFFIILFAILIIELASGMALGAFGGGLVVSEDLRAVAMEGRYRASTNLGKATEKL